MIEYKSEPLPFRGGVRYSKVDSGDHTGSPLRRTHGSSANYKYMSSIPDIVGQGSRSVRTRLILLTFPVGKSYATSAVLPLSHKSRAFVGTLVRFVGKRRRRP